MADMTLKEAEKLLSSLRKAKSEELSALRKAWQNPTKKQAKRLAKLEEEIQVIRKYHRALKNFWKM